MWFRTSGWVVVPGQQGDTDLAGERFCDRGLDGGCRSIEPGVSGKCERTVRHQPAVGARMGVVYL